MDRLKGKVIVVTGAARGIGFGIAKACSAAGAGVVMVDSNPDVKAAAEAIASVALNLEAPFHWSQAAIKTMLGSGGGSIVNISTIEATHARPRHFPYIVSKSALNSFTRAVAVDFGRRGIRCNTISPGSVDTEMYKIYTAQYPGLREHLIGLNFAGRLGTTAEIGAAAVYLLSDETLFLNGHELIIDGARTVAT